MSSLQNLSWLMISWGIILPLQYIGDFFMTQWRNPYKLTMCPNRWYIVEWTLISYYMESQKLILSTIRSIAAEASLQTNQYTSRFKMGFLYWDMKKSPIDWIVSSSIIINQPSFISYIHYTIPIFIHIPMVKLPLDSRIPHPTFITWPLRRKPALR